MTTSGAPKPEIMSPAGYYPELRAAVEAGADAVYFGIRRFSARAKVGFEDGELPEVMKELHRRGVKGYVTLNTLVFEHELGEMARVIALVAEAGADAIIVQDWATVRLAREIAPELDVHASTQMTLTSAEGIALAQSMGVKRVVLARELSFDDLRAIRAATSCELEIFVHGALCVSYSGQCYSSEAWGGRSANRGQCAQACRLPYDLVKDGIVEPLGDARYLLSPGDLYALRHIPEIMDIGISALKIEGRYKDADYVALTTRAYRRAVDAASEGRDARPSVGEELQLEQVYSRRMGPYFLTGVNHQNVVRGRSTRHRGVLMGQVLEVNAQDIVIQPERRPALESPLKSGDGLVFDGADWKGPADKEEGGRVYHVDPVLHGALRLRFATGAVNPAGVRPGDLVWRTADPEVHRAARVWTEAPSPMTKQPVHVHVRVVERQPIESIWTLAGTVPIVVRVSGTVNSSSAKSRPTEEGVIREHLGRLGNTPYTLGELSLQVVGNPFVPLSEWNDVRRRAVEQLEGIQSAPRERMISDPQESLAAVRAAVEVGAAGRHEASVPEDETSAVRDAGAPHAETGVAATRTPGPVALHLLVRTPEQLDGAISFRPESITLDYLDLEGLRPSVERVKEAGIRVRVAGPRILKPNEERIVTLLRKLQTEILVRSPGLLGALGPGHEHAYDADFSFNAANDIAAGMLLGLGVRRLTPSHDLNGAQVEHLLGALGGERVEIIGYQHLPVFHTEHCVFCRFLSQGTSYKDCGRPCESHRVALRDVTGREHPVLADVGCRNTVFGAEAQQGSRHLEDWTNAGLRHLRLEFAHETADQVVSVAMLFRECCDGRITARELGRRLRVTSPSGTTEGSLYVPEGFKRIEVAGLPS